MNHIQRFSHRFHDCFIGDVMRMFDWIWNPFDCLLANLADHEQKELARLSSNWS